MSTHGSKTTMHASSLCRLKEPAYKESTSSFSQAPWTAARCQRLLRPLSSKIALLRKLRQAEAHKKKTEVKNAPNTQEAGLSEENNKSSFDSRTACHRAAVEEGTEWEDGPRLRKRMRWTYSARGSAHNIEPEEMCSSVRPSGSKDGSTDMLSGLLEVAGTTKSPFSTHIHEEVDGSGCTDRSGTLSMNIAGPSCVTSGFTGLRNKLATNTTLIALGDSREERTLHRGIADSMMALLISTGEVSKRESSGCRPLFSMCLKYVPYHIIEEEQRVVEEDPDSDLDISCAIYTQLEDCAAGNSWEPFREVVRNHGVLLIETAIRDGTITNDAAHALDTLCMTQGVYDEAQSILQATVFRLSYGNSQSPPSRNLVKDRVYVLKQLRNFTQRTGRTGFLYQQLRCMLENENPWAINNQLFREALNGATRAAVQISKDLYQAARFLLAIIRAYYFGSSWTVGSEAEKLRQISQTKPRRTSFPSGLVCLENPQFLDTLGSLPQDAPSHAPQSDWLGTSLHTNTLIAMISAFNHARSREPEETCYAAGRAMPAILDEVATEAHQHLELALLSRIRQDIKPQWQHLSILFMENYLRSSMCSGNFGGLSKTTFSDLDVLSRLELANNDLKELGSFVNQIARCYGIIQKIDAFEFIESAVGVLAKAAKERRYRSETCSLVGKIAVVIAFMFSEDTGQPSHLDWALGIEQSLWDARSASSRSALITPVKAPARLKDDYRWEEGICEWIARTPAMQLCQPSTPASTSYNSDDSDDVLTKFTPMTSPGLEATSSFESFERSSGEESRKQAGLAKSGFKWGNVMVKYVRIANDEGDYIGRLEGASVGRNWQRAEEVPPRSKAAQYDSDCGEPDELSAAQDGNAKAARFNHLELRKRPHKKRGAVKGMKRLRRREESGLPVMTKRVLGTQLDAIGVERLVDHLGTSSDGEDELSFC